MIRYLNLFFILLILIFSVAIFLHTDSAITQDLGRHLVLGKIIWEKRSVPGTNLFSYAYPDFPFINHHWGSEVIFYLIEKASSVNGLIILKLILAVFAFFLLFLFSFGKVGFVSLMTSSFLALEILGERTEVRPEIFAYFYFCLFLLILYREKRKEKRLIWALPLLELMWVNMHISFCLGLAVYFLFLLDRLISKKLSIKYLAIGLLLAVSSLINPFGWQGAIYPLQIFQNYGYPVVENQSPFFLEQTINDPTISYFKAAIFLLLFITPFLLSKRYIFEITSVITTGILSSMAIRHFPFFGLSMIFPLSLGLTVARDKIYSYLKILQINIFRIEILTGAIIIGLLSREIYSLLSNRYYLRQGSIVRTGFGQVIAETKAVDFFIKSRLSGPIFNNFDIGSYLIYRLYPTEKVFVDGRPEAYPAAFFQDTYIPMQEKEDVWEKMETKYKFQTIIFSHTDATSWGRQFLKRIIGSPDWVVVYFDDCGIVVAKKDILPKDIEPIDTKEKMRSTAISLIQQASQPDSLLRLANFFNLTEFTDLEFLSRVKARNILNQ
ncbi:hypothetical protein FJY90_01520 [Candidatus Gottesmanbacteria bacterium]|nr:hypothetical protein [Candidatus Gottesmanbacteria bacterium]